jgi:ectoine hydroxylase-related dioxygenase (phytanoyl-CoA dioxygenase family)
MPKGSCIIYSGDVFHSAAANATEDVKVRRNAASSVLSVFSFT